ncbi:MAG TPA: DUF58 domain-containing protein [Clostridia bacterium]|nr:DUF58 domain-containing protein [Clostridia bacterium]
MRARIIYCLVLTGLIGIAYVFNSQLSRIILLLVIVMPIVSLLLSIPALFCISASIVNQKENIERGDVFDLFVIIENSSFFLFPFIEFTLDCDPGIKLLVNKSIRVSLDSREKIRVTAPSKAINRGSQSISIKKIYAVDCLGIFKIPIRTVRTNLLSLLVLPRINLKSDYFTLKSSVPNKYDASISNVEYSSSGKDGFQGELREFQPGDSIRGIHWKLYAKTGQMLVRAGNSINAGKISIALNPFIRHSKRDVEPKDYPKQEELKELEDKLVESFLSIAGSILSGENTLELWLYDEKSWQAVNAVTSGDLFRLQSILAGYKFLYESSGSEIEKLLKNNDKGKNTLLNKINILECDTTGIIMLDGKAV